jgi:hypothetical protein
MPVQISQTQCDKNTDERDHGYVIMVTRCNFFGISEKNQIFTKQSPRSPAPELQDPEQTALIGEELADHQQAILHACLLNNARFVESYNRFNAR